MGTSKARPAVQGRRRGKAKRLAGVACRAGNGGGCMEDECVDDKAVAHTRQVEREVEVGKREDLKAM